MIRYYNMDPIGAEVIIDDDQENVIYSRIDDRAWEREVVVDSSKFIAFLKPRRFEIISKRDMFAILL